jgi:hypothetical protein
MKLFVSGTRANFGDRRPESLTVALPAQPEPRDPVASSSTDAGSGTRAAACEDVRSIGNVEICPRTIGPPWLVGSCAGMTMSRLLMPRDAIKPRT